jgi:RNA polymerase sigma factor (sigma-70 family)
MTNTLVQVVAREAAPSSPSEVPSELTAQYRRLLTYARTLTRNEAVAEDLVHDTLERALRARHQFRAGTNAAAWLTRILRNRFTDQCRHRTAVREIGLEHAIGTAAAEEPRGPSVLDVVTDGDVVAALERLTFCLREAFWLRHVEGLSYEEMAARFRVPQSTVGTRLRRARLALRRIIEARLAAAGQPGVLLFRPGCHATAGDADRAASPGLAVLRAGRRRARADRPRQP